MKKDFFGMNSEFVNEIGGQTGSPGKSKYIICIEASILRPVAKLQSHNPVTFVMKSSKI